MSAKDGARTFSALVALLALWLLFVGWSVYSCGDGFLHPETYGFIPHYLSPRPVLELIYDHDRTNWGTYQARELSHLFDWLDVQFIAKCVDAGRPHFFSLTHYAFLLAAGIATWRVANRYFGLGHVVSIGLALLLWTAPTAVLYSSYYRTAKVGLCLAALLFVWAWNYSQGFARTWGKPGIWPATALWLAGVAMPMFDKQGLLFLIAGAAFLAARSFATKERSDRVLFGVGGAALCFAILYNHALDPWITERLLGYRPSFDYQSFPAAEFFSSPQHVATVGVGAPLFALDSLRFLAGDLPLGVVLLGIAGMHWLFLRSGSEQSIRASKWFTPAAVHVATWICVMGVFALLLIWLPGLFSNEHRRFFYGLPVTSIWLVVLMSAASATLRIWPACGKWLVVVIGTLVLSNVTAMPEHRFVLRHGKYRPFVENATKVRHALQPSEIAAQGIPPKAAEDLLKSAHYFRDAVPPSLREDRIFLLFLARTAAIAHQRAAIVGSDAAFAGLQMSAR